MVFTIDDPPHKKSPKKTLAEVHQESPGQTCDSPFNLPHEVGIISGKVFIKGQYNSFPAEWKTVGTLSRKDMASFSPDRFTFIVHTGSSPENVLAAKPSDM